MKKFRTHLIVNNKDSDKIRSLTFTNIKLELITEPTKVYWESKDGRSSSMHFYRTDPKKIQADEIPMNELLVEAENEQQVEDFISVLQAGMLLGFPDGSLAENFPIITEYKEENNSLYLNSDFAAWFKKFGDVAFGCSIAERIIMDNQIVYALEKYKTSLGLISFNPHSADPRYGQVFDHYDIKREYHTKAAFAIIAAFSVIEELGLEIRSSQKKRRFLNPDAGQWNPEVLDDIKERLVKSNIPEKLTFDWIYRGRPTKIEEEIKPYFGIDSEWTKYGKEVRDKTLTIPEAIHNTSYLRNYIAAHKFNEFTQYLSPYDIFNTQMLARVLILHRLSMWQYMIDRHV